MRKVNEGWEGEGAGGGGGGGERGDPQNVSDGNCTKSWGFMRLLLVAP